MNEEIRQNIQEKENKKRLGLDFFQKQLYNSLLKGDLTPEQLPISLDVPVGSIGSAFTIMEMMDVMERMPGNVYSIK